MNDEKEGERDAKIDKGGKKEGVQVRARVCASRGEGAGKSRRESRAIPEKAWAEAEKRGTVRKRGKK
jgi:hypothetical protein